MQASQAALLAGETSPETHNTLDMMSRNRVANMAFTVCSAGEVVVLAVLVGVLFAVHSDASTENNTRALSIVAAYSGAVWRMSRSHTYFSVLLTMVYVQSSVLYRGSCWRSIDPVKLFPKDQLIGLSASRRFGPR